MADYSRISEHIELLRPKVEIVKLLQEFLWSWQQSVSLAARHTPAKRFTMN